MPLERRAKVWADLETPDGKTHFVRVAAVIDDGRWVVRSAGGQGSHQLLGMAAANALAVVPDGDGVAAGARLDVLLLVEPIAATSP